MEYCVPSTCNPYAAADQGQCFVFVFDNSAVSVHCFAS